MPATRIQPAAQIIGYRYDGLLLWPADDDDKAGTHVSVADARSLEQAWSYKKQMKVAKKVQGKAVT